MRQHVNPLSKNFFEIDPIPPLNQVFENPKLPLHLDIGCASGDFLFELSLKNKNWKSAGNSAPVNDFEGPAVCKT